jgi:hypothetical protein
MGVRKKKEHIGLRRHCRAQTDSCLTSSLFFSLLFFSLLSFSLLSLLA